MKAKTVKDYIKEIPSFNHITEVIEDVYNIRETIEDPKIHTQFVNKVREIVQEEAVKAIENGPDKALVVMATGAGKTKVAIDYAKKVNGKQVLLVPTEKLRDQNWSDEYKKWGAEEISDKTSKYCYASASKIKQEYFNLAILDEGHNITENNSLFFKQNKIDKTVLLTATIPDENKDFEKYNILLRLGFKLVYHLTLDQAVKLGFVAPYEINVIEIPLESKEKTVKGGSKAKPFMTTEKEKYRWLSQTVENSRYAKFPILNRMRFIYNLPSKLNAAKEILDSVIPKGERGLIFSSSIKQAEELCSNTFHSKSNHDDYDKFKRGEIDRLSCVKALNEGHNFEALDFGLVVQLTSKEKDLIQRIGRLIRVRPGHRARIFILVAMGTQDETWLKKAIGNLDESSISYYSYSNLKKQKFYED